MDSRRLGQMAQRFSRSRLSRRAALASGGAGVASALLGRAGLTPRVPGWSRIKLSVAPFFTEFVMSEPYINPRWSDDPGLTRGKLFSKAVSLFHRECNVPACHMLSLMWGTGWPALYSHDKLEDVTHRSGFVLLGYTSLNYYRLVSKMIRAGSSPVKYDMGNPELSALQDDYFA